MNRDERIELVAKTIQVAVYECEGHCDKHSHLALNGATAAINALQPLHDRDIQEAKREGAREALQDANDHIIALVAEQEALHDRP